jgi:hypothetical protein
VINHGFVQKISRPMARWELLQRRRSHQMNGGRRILCERIMWIDELAKTESDAPRIKLKAIFVWLIVWAFQATAQGPATPPKLTGIVNLPGLRVALLEKRERMNYTLVLREGERQGEIELLQILPEVEAVKVRIGGNSDPISLNMQSNSPPEKPTRVGLFLENAQLVPILGLYGEMTKRSLLRPPTLASTSISVNAAVTNSTEAARVLEKVLAEKGIVTILDGDKFVMVVPKHMAATAIPRSAQIKSSDTNTSTMTIPPKDIIFWGATLDQVAAIYSEFAGRKFDHSQRTPPSPPITFQNVTPLTREEFFYAMDTLLAWNGIKLVPADGGLMRAVPVSEK